MKNYDIISIPVAPHVRKFMMAAFGDVYQVSKNDPLGLMIISMLSKRLSDLDTYTACQKMSEHFQIAISMSLFQKEGFWIDHPQKRTIGRMLDLYFREIMFAHAVMSKCTNQVDYTKSILDFCNSLNITTDDIDLDTLYKDFKRKKSPKRQNIISNLHTNTTKRT